MAALTSGDISEMGYGAINEIGILRENIMSQVAQVANNTTSDVNFSAMGVMSSNSSVGAVNITTGAGALVLDDVLQALSTVEQASAQLVSAENKAQQQVNSLARG